MSRFNIHSLPLAGLKLIERKPFGDSRGFLARLFCENDLVKCGWSQPVSQINQTYTAKKGTVRGLHYQCPPHAEMKLVSCLQGQIWDVAVDLRLDSPTFLHWYGAELSAENNHALLIPEGFAHGFQTLSNDVELLYCHSAAYDSKAEAGIHIMEPLVAIEWPLTISECSERDQSFPLLDDEYLGVNLNEV